MAAPQTKSKKLIRYKFSPKSNLHAIAKSEEKIEDLKEQRSILQLARQGNNAEQIAAKLGVTPQEATRVTKMLVARYLTDCTLSSIEQRHLQASIYDDLIVRLQGELEPRPMFDAKGKPVIDITYDPDSEKPRFKAAMRPMDPMYVKLLLETLDRKAKLLGLDKMEDEQIKEIERRYVGANPDDV